MSISASPQQMIISLRPLWPYHALADDEVAIQPRLARRNNGIGCLDPLVEGGAWKRQHRLARRFARAERNHLMMHRIELRRIAFDGSAKQRMRDEVVDGKDGEHGVD